MNQQASTERALLIASCMLEMNYSSAVGQMLLLCRAFSSDRPLWTVLAQHRGRGGRTWLMQAAMADNVGRVGFLLDRGADAGGTSARGESATSLACQGGHEGVVRLLVDMAPEAALSARASDCSTPLIWASSADHLDLARYLVLDKGVDVNAARSSDGFTSLMLAAMFGHEGTAHFLAECHGINLSASLASGDTALTLACEARRYAVVLCLAEAGGAALSAARSSDGKTALMLAIDANCAATVSHLLRNGAAASINAVCSAGGSALSRASALGNPSIIHMLHSHGAAPTTAAARAEHLMLALNNGHSETAVALLKYGAAAGSEPLLVAAKKGFADVVRALLQGGANCLAADANGCTVLHLAASKGSVEIVRALLEGGATCLTADAAGRTALHMAAAAGSAPVIYLLCIRGACVNAAATGWLQGVIPGVTPFMLAARSGSVEAAKALRDFPGTNVHAKDYQGSAAHSYAKSEEMKEYVKALMGEGKDTR